MPRTNHSGVTEVAHIRTDIDKYGEGWERIFGRKSEPEQVSGNISEENEVFGNLDEDGGADYN